MLGEGVGDAVEVAVGIVVDVALGVFVTEAVGSGVAGVAVGFFVAVAAGREVELAVGCGVGKGVAVAESGGRNRKRPASIRLDSRQLARIMAYTVVPFLRASEYSVSPRCTKYRLQDC
jgi:hypothetical protein